MAESERASKLHTITGRAVEELTMEGILSGELTEEDFRISGDALIRQAEDAEAAGYRQLGQSLRRAAELTRVSNEKVLEIYNALRPGRTSYAQLIALAEWLEQEQAAPLTAALVREAAEEYIARGLIPQGE